MSLNAYRQARTVAEHPRATERRLFAEITADLIAARDGGMKGAPLVAALHRQRELWQTLGTLCGDRDNGLPPSLRAGIISLALWVDRHSSAIVRGEGEIDDLIEVNRSIMEGLG